jgi:glycosyltransferase involved in cell wall biosynthesis
VKICLLISLTGPSQGGLQLLILRLAQYLKKQGHDVRIIGRFTKGRPLRDYPVRMEPPRVFAVEGVDMEIISVQGWRRWLLQPVYRLIWRRTTFPIARGLYQAAFRPVIDRALEGAEFIHYLGAGVELLGYAALAHARQKKIPFVVEPAMHVGQWGDFPRDWPLYREADLVIAHTKFEAGVLCRQGVNASHVHAVRHGFDALEPGDGAKFRSRLGIEGPMILFVGRRSEAKGYFRLLTAFATLRQSMPNVTLVIAGPGEAASSTAAGVLELGLVTDEIKQDALAACTVFCLPSEGESFGMAYFEAWTCGKPVVALDLPVLRETIGASGGGLLAAPDRPEELVEKLRLLLEQPELAAAMGARGREFSRGYSWNAAVASYLEAYSQAQQNQRQSLDRFILPHGQKPSP